MDAAGDYGVQASLAMDKRSKQSLFQTRADQNQRSNRSDGREASMKPKNINMDGADQSDERLALRYQFLKTFLVSDIRSQNKFLALV